jgi:hypothetical protein
LFRLSNQWLWLNGASRLFAWRPGEEIRQVSQRNDARFVFELGDRLFLLGADGNLYERVVGNSLSELAKTGPFQ